MGIVTMSGVAMARKTVDNELGSIMLFTKGEKNLIAQSLV
jgi:hypothetical protein